MPNDIGLLRRLATGSETAGDRAVLAERLRAYLEAAPTGQSLDASFGLLRSPGVIPWWRREALDRRDAVLRALAARHHSGLPVARQAAVIRSAMLCYRASAWRFDREANEPPVRYLGTPREAMFDALKAVDAVPSARHLRRILRP